MKPCAVPLILPFCEAESVTQIGDSIEIKAKVKPFPGVCPSCGQISNRIHGYYQRTILDLPMSQLVVRINLRVRRFHCPNKACRQLTFTQQVHGLIQRYQRVTYRLAMSLYHIAQALGGRGGARLAKKLAMPTSGDSLLRLIRRAAPTYDAQVRVLGVDDWALRKGQNYGTILVDLQAGELWICFQTARGTHCDLGALTHIMWFQD